MTGGVYLRGKVYWIHYRADGERVFESAETGDKRAAQALLAKRRAEIRSGTWVRPTSHTGALKVATYLERWIAKRRKTGVRCIRDEARWLWRFAIPMIGDLHMSDVERRHIAAIMERVSEATHHRTGEPLASRTQLHIYTAIATAFSDAVIDGLIAVSPCTLRTRRGELPKKRDKGNWRAEAVYDREAVATLVRDERVPIDRRALYALMLLAGMRDGEARGRRWRDYEPDAWPLGRLTVHTQSDGADDERQTKTGKVLVVPVVPELARLLAEWRGSFAIMFGRAPTGDDPIVPSRRGVDRFRIKTHQTLCDDIARLGLRRPPAARHSMRATFLTLLEASGADMSIAERATHGAPISVVGGYVRTQWAELCREVAKLRLDGDSNCDSGPGMGRNGGVSMGFVTPGAGLEAVRDPAQPGLFAHFDDMPPDDGLPWRPTNIGAVGLETQSVTHVTARLAETMAMEALDRAELAGEEWS